MSDRPTCETCRWWDDLSWWEEYHGYCRVLPPSCVKNHADEDLGPWPVTRASDWCGEHAPVEGAKGGDDGR